MKRKGGITVFLTLMLSVISAFIMILAKSVRTYLIKSEAMYAVDNAVRSCFAEYNRELFDRFHILVIDSSYKTDEAGMDRVTDHFSTYLENSMTGCDLSEAGITGYKNAGEDGHYLYESAVRYARSELSADERFSGEEDDRYFLTYLISVLGNDEIAEERSCRRGETEYLLYGLEDDQENIMWAHMDHDEAGSGTYGEYLCKRLGEEDISVVEDRFADLVTEYMRANESPGFDLNECYHDLSFTASLKWNGPDVYTVTGSYAYDR